MYSRSDYARNYYKIYSFYLLKLNYLHIFFYYIFFYCFFVNLKADQILGNGYPLEIYETETKDHYMLGLERIPYSKNGNKTIGKPIILLHGLYGTSMFFTLTNKSLSKCI